MDESRKLRQQMSLATRDMREVQVKASAMAKKVGDARKELGLIKVAGLKKREEMLAIDREEPSWTSCWQRKPGWRRPGPAERPW